MGGAKERGKRLSGGDFVTSEHHDETLTVTSTRKGIVYDAQLLRESMGEDDYSAVVGRVAIIRVSLPRRLDPRATTSVIRSGLSELGETAARRATIEIKPEVDETILAAKENSGEVTLRPGTRRSTRR